MNTTSKNSNDIKSAFDHLFEELAEKDRLENDAKVLMFRFLEIVDQKREALGWSRKTLAEKVGTSASYIAQLYNGNKLVNMTILAKFQQVLGLTFDISEKTAYANTVQNYQPIGDEQGFWIYRPFEKPDYKKVPNNMLLLPERNKVEVA